MNGLLEENVEIEKERGIYENQFKPLYGQEKYKAAASLCDSHPLIIRHLSPAEYETMMPHLLSILNSSIQEQLNSW